MYCTRAVTEDVAWVGGDDRRLAMFEGVYSVPRGVSYNSYLLKDEKTVLFDAVDKAVSRVFLENVEHELAGRPLDYIIVQHMEPDHSATLTQLRARHPEAQVLCSDKSAVMLRQFFGDDLGARAVKEGETLQTGAHTLRFFMAPMVHWPEVMVTFDEKDGTLFSADAFGTFGALNGALFADEMDFEREGLDEARRYYTNIVGKYGFSVQTLLKKAASVPVRRICPLHGPVWRENLDWYVEKYRRWSLYQPEEQGVMIAYASVYGNTENAANLLACRLREKGVRTVMYDASVTPASEILSQAFRWSHLVFASTTYNAGVFVTMDELLRDIAAHSLQGRFVGLMQNGSWAPQAGKLMRDILAGCKDFTFLEPVVTLRSALAEGQLGEIDALVQAIVDTLRG
ncbi:MAG: FprA family A-type flavoprotein [Eubacteriales bacterium]|nr:FprA family A-type flavoprotein [Eubacteriales bacterium]